MPSRFLIYQLEIEIRVGVLLRVRISLGLKLYPHKLLFLGVWQV